MVCHTPKQRPRFAVFQLITWSKFVEILVAVCAARFLGHGRAMESYLALFAGSYGIAILFIPDAAFSSSAMRDIAWEGYSPHVALLFISKAALTGYGLAANIKNWRWSRQFRIVGAIIGLWIWSSTILKFVIVGNPYTLGAFAAFWCFIFSVRIIALAIANLPRPGVSGSL